MINSKNGLLLLDGFDEIINEIEKKQCYNIALSMKIIVIMTSRPNAIRSYLINPQDIQNYVMHLRCIVLRLYTYSKDYSKQYFLSIEHFCVYL
ncbi:hypothetical protein RFI_34501 [Reticulomyxa filosa]|uniref:Uncharacterized protein n=1 Tax=Reticulomyxa filosa TaxID=46433 RepID=X6LP61_RETFI|nr:hypothetical protein RFI_34501 [Reticulomyxa filosa]|eukprot:ETO02912.1 hypothetical protein RFI_34501 [Reticulomyxa filosa]